MTERPKWPDSLPPLVEWEMKPGGVCLAVEDFPDQLTVAELVHDLYWNPEPDYFVFHPSGEGFPADLYKEFTTHGLELKRGESYFFRHPKPMAKNDFVQVLPTTTEPPWLVDAGRGKMYQRLAVSLAYWKRKELDHLELAQLTATETARRMERPTEIIELKPGVFGFRINLKALWKIWVAKRKR